MTELSGVRSLRHQLADAADTNVNAVRSSDPYMLISRVEVHRW
jgi:hypothetical protein